MREQIPVVKMLNAATTTSTSESFDFWGDSRGFTAIGSTSSGAGAAVVVIEVSPDNSNWQTLGTISLTLSTTAALDGFRTLAGVWKYTRARITSISGTNAAVTVWAASY